MTTTREQARAAKSAGYREMRTAAATEIVQRRRSLGEALEDAKSGATPILETTDLAQLSAVVLVRAMHLLDEFAHDETQDPGFRANCARNNGELALKLADHLVNARPERDGNAAQRVVVVREQDMDAIERSLMAEAG